MSREKVSRLRALLSEARPNTPPARSDTENEAWRHFQRFETFAAPLPAESSWRARAVREITRIGGWYGWTGEIQRSLDAAGCDLLSSLSDDALTELRDRMRNLEDCAQSGMGPPDAPPAS